MEDAFATITTHLTYLWRHRRKLNLKSAPRFTEMVQRRKLFDRDPRQIQLMDKIAAKSIAADRLGPDWVTPTIWKGKQLPPDIPFSAPAMLKARHGCNQNAILRHSPNRAEWAQLQKRTSRWTSKPYGFWLSEWAYRYVERGLIAEPLLGDGIRLPVDFKIYVFGGCATHVQIHLGRGSTHRWFLHDRDFRPLVPSLEKRQAPHSLTEMLAAAEELARGYDFLRVDFFEVDRRPRFVEFCLYPGSGLDPFAADWIDFELGALWRSVSQSI